jgi:hypothetical protein
MLSKSPTAWSANRQNNKAAPAPEPLITKQNPLPNYQTKPFPLPMETLSRIPRLRRARLDVDDGLKEGFNV